MRLNKIEAYTTVHEGRQTFIDCKISSEVDGHLIHTQDMRCATDLIFIPNMPVPFEHCITFRFTDKYGHTLSVQAKLGEGE